MLTLRRGLAGLLVSCAGLGFTHDARADIVIRDPDPPKYAVELEPKLNLNYFLFERYGGRAWGPGIRASIPVMSPGFVRSINDNVAITFGADILRYEGGDYYGWYYFCRGNPRNCPGWYAGYDASFWALQLPVALQWNFYLATHWSVFGEVGLTLRHAFYGDSWCDVPNYDPRWGPCHPDPTTLFFTFYGGGRYHFNEKIGLTMRVGHPNAFSIGLSIYF